MGEDELEVFCFIGGPEDGHEPAAVERAAKHADFHFYSHQLDGSVRKSRYVRTDRRDEEGRTVLLWEGLEEEEVYAEGR